MAAAVASAASAASQPPASSPVRQAGLGGGRGQGGGLCSGQHVVHQRLQVCINGAMSVQQHGNKCSVTVQSLPFV